MAGAPHIALETVEEPSLLAFERGRGRGGGEGGHGRRQVVAEGEVDAPCRNPLFRLLARVADGGILGHVGQEGPTPVGDGQAVQRVVDRLEHGRERASAAIAAGRVHELAGLGQRGVGQRQDLVRRRGKGHRGPPEMGVVRAQEPEPVCHAAGLRECHPGAGGPEVRRPARWPTDRPACARKSGPMRAGDPGVGRSAPARPRVGRSAPAPMSRLKPAARPLPFGPRPTGGIAVSMATPAATISSSRLDDLTTATPSPRGLPRKPSHETHQRRRRRRDRQRVHRHGAHRGPAPPRRERARTARGLAGARREAGSRARPAACLRLDGGAARRRPRRGRSTSPRRTRSTSRR